MDTITIDNDTYRELQSFAKSNNVDVADVVRKSFKYFSERFKNSTQQSQTAQYQLPSHLKKMRGVLSGVDDKGDEKLNRILSK